MISPAASAAAKLAIALRYATAGFGIVVAAGAMLIWTKDIFILLFGFRSAEDILPGIDERRALLFDDHFLLLINSLSLSGYSMFLYHFSELVCFPHSFSYFFLCAFFSFS